MPFYVKKKLYFLERKENNSIFVSFYIDLIDLDKKHVIIRLARSLDPTSNLLGMGCFKKDNKIVKIKRVFSA